MRGGILGVATAALVIVACSDPSGPATSGPAAVASIEIVLRNDTLSAGDTATVQAIPRNVQGQQVTGVTVSLSSSDTAVVRLESGVLARSRKAGTAVITAIAGSASANLTLTVVPGAAASLAIEQDTLRFIALQQELDLDLVAEDEYGNALDPAAIEWISRDTTVAKPLGAAAVQSRGTGETWVVAQSGSVADSAIMVVEQVLYALELTPAQDTLNAIGDTLALVGTAVDVEGQPIGGTVVAWAALDAAVATVDDEGRVVSVATGTARVEGRIGLLTDTAVIVSRQVPASVDLRPDTVALAPAAVLPLLVSVQDSNGVAVPDASLTWSSSDPAAVDVSESGELTVGSGAGAVIRAQSEELADSVVAIVDADGVLRTWRGGYEGAPTQFANPYNWWYGGQPGPQDTVRVDAGTTESPLLTAAAEVARVEVLAGASLDLGSFNLAVTHSVEAPGTFTGSLGRLVVSGLSVQVSGFTPQLLVTGRAIVGSGNLRIQRQLRVEGGQIRSDGQRIQVDNQ